MCGRERAGREARRGGDRLLEAVLARLPEDPAGAERLVRSPRTLAELEWAAQRAGLRSLLAHYLPAGVSRERPSGERFAQFMAARNLQLTTEVVGLLRAQGIPSAVLKGVPLGQRLYPRAWMRPTTDADVLVAAPDMEKATAVLESAGFHSARPRWDVPFNRPHHRSFSRASDSVEIHWTAFGRFRYLAAVETQVLLKRSLEMEMGGEALRVLRPADELVQLSLHAFDHALQGVKWLFDLKLLIRRAEFDWAECVAAARAARVERPVGFVLAEARKRVRAPVPDWVLSAMGAGAGRSFIMRILPAVQVSREWYQWAGELFFARGRSGAWVMRMIMPPMVGAARPMASWLAGIRREGRATSGLCNRYRNLESDAVSRGRDLDGLGANRE